MPAITASLPTWSALSKWLSLRSGSSYALIRFTNEVCTSPAVLSVAGGFSHLVKLLLY